jgi:hypothetical protein
MKSVCDPERGLTLVPMRSVVPAKMGPSSAILNGVARATRAYHDAIPNWVTRAYRDTSLNEEISEWPRKARPRMVISVPGHNPRLESVTPAPGRNAHLEK